MHTPLFKGIVQSCLGSVEAVELAAIRPPVQFLLEFNANTKHFQGSFLPIRFPPGRDIDTTTNLRFSWHHDFRIWNKFTARITAARKIEIQATNVHSKASFFTVNAVDAKSFLVHFFCPPINLAFTPRYNIRSCSSA